MNIFQVVGQVPLPQPLANLGNVDTGPAKLLQLTLRSLVMIAGIYALINLVVAGYAFMSAGDDPQKVAGAWRKIWQTLLGLAFSAGAFVIAAIIGKLLFGDWAFLLRPQIPAL